MDTSKSFFHNYSINEMADAYGEVLMNGFIPETMIVADPRMLEEAGLEPGTWLFRKGQEPIRVGETEDFEVVGFGTLGVTSIGIKSLAEELPVTELKKSILAKLDNDQHGEFEDNYPW